MYITDERKQLRELTWSVIGKSTFEKWKAEERRIEERIAAQRKARLAQQGTPPMPSNPESEFVRNPRFAKPYFAQE
ncbi:MAG TPA: hypothetical protein VE968_08885 [Sphingomicrobium sp.]|nr:hypothetical protein [Sphingomicrobium sp.]